MPRVADTKSVLVGVLIGGLTVGGVYYTMRDRDVHPARAGHISNEAYAQLNCASPGVRTGVPTEADKSYGLRRDAALLAKCYDNSVNGGDGREPNGTFTTPKQ